jgi:hypothetical protein
MKFNHDRQGGLLPVHTATAPEAEATAQVVRQQFHFKQSPQTSIHRELLSATRPGIFA